MRRLLPYLLLFLLIPFLGTAQTDTVFWFALPPTPDPGRFVFHTYDRPAVVTVSQPANPSAPVASISLGAHNFNCYTISSSEFANSVTAPYNTVLNRGYLITSTAPITCYYQITTAQRETFTLKGHNALGTDFIVLSPTTFSATGESLTMIATEDSTLLRIIASNYVSSGSIALLDSIGLGDTMTVTLNRGQSYAVQTPIQIGLYRAKIHASQPVAVSFSNNAMRPRNSNSVNPGGEQLVPLTHWGLEYVRINSFTSSDYFRATSITDTGSYHTWPWRGSGPCGGDWNVGWPFNFPDSAHYFWVDRPIGMMHRQSPNDLMATTVIPHLACAGSHQVSYLHADSTHLAINMIVPTRAVNDIRFNGSSTILTAANFRPVPWRRDLSWCNMDVSSYVPANSVMTVSCSKDKFLLAVIESDSLRGTAYTYLTDYAPAISVRFEMDSVYCEDDRIDFTYHDYRIDSVALHYPDGRTFTHPPFFIPHADSTDEGTYIIEGFNTSYGLVYTDSIHIHVQRHPMTEYSDTIPETRLPWTYRGCTFLSEADTFFITEAAGICDTLHHYTLHVLYGFRDTLWFYVCKSYLPFHVDSITFESEGSITVTIPQDDGLERTLTYILHIIADSDTSITDTIVENLLPWMFRDSLFYDTVTDHPFILVNEAGCDSIIHYSLFVFWDGDHCDTSLTFPTLVTPNGDGVNDRFVIGGLLENNCFRFNDLLIYDRTGQLVYHGHNISRDEDFWDPAAHRAPDATYFYVFKAHGVTIHTMHQGVIEVLR